MLDWLGIPRHLPSLFLRTLSFQLRSTSSSLLLHSCIQTVCIWTWPARNRDDSHTDFGETLPLYSGQVTKLLSVIPGPPPLHSFDRAEWHSTYIQWLSQKYLHQRKRCAHKPWLDGLGPPYRDVRMTPG